MKPGDRVRVRLWNGERAEGRVTHPADPRGILWVDVDSGPGWAVGASPFYSHDVEQTP